MRFGCAGEVDVDVQVGSIPSAVKLARRQGLMQRPLLGIVLRQSQRAEQSTKIVNARAKRNKTKKPKPKSKSSILPSLEDRRRTAGSGRNYAFWLVCLVCIYFGFTLFLLSRDGNVFSGPKEEGV